MKTRVLIAGLLVQLAFAGVVFALPNLPDEYEIEYDGNSALHGFMQCGPGSECELITVRFSIPEPPGPPANLIRARLYVWNNTEEIATYDVIVMNENLLPLRTIVTSAPPMTEGWYDYEIDPPVPVYGDFYIAMNWTTTVEDLWLGFTHEPVDGRTYAGPPLVAVTLGDGEIRAVVTEAEGVPSLTTWGILSLALFLTCSGIWIFGRRGTRIVKA